MGQAITAGDGGGHCSLSDWICPLCLWAVYLMLWWADDGQSMVCVLQCNSAGSCVLWTLSQWISLAIGLRIFLGLLWVGFVFVWQALWWSDCWVVLVPWCHGFLGGVRIRGPLAKSVSPPFCSKWPRSWIWLVLLSLSGRIGEASVPGPNVEATDGVQFTLGVCNPNGLTDKSSFFGSSRIDLWLICETHLTVSGMRTFERMLGWQAPQYSGKVFGHPVLARSEVSDVGRWSGVGMLSQWPIHRLPHEWPTLVHATGRLCVSTAFVHGQWISGCVVYGTPTGPTHGNARQTTDQLLEHALCRVLQLSGPRYVGGDFNHDHDRLTTVAAMRQIGFVDIQDLHALRTGVYPVATCRGKTRRDFLSWRRCSSVARYKIVIGLIIACWWVNLHVLHLTWRGFRGHVLIRLNGQPLRIDLPLRSFRSRHRLMSLSNTPNCGLTLKRLFKRWLVLVDNLCQLDVLVVLVNACRVRLRFR